MVTGKREEVHSSSSRVLRILAHCLLLAWVLVIGLWFWRETDFRRSIAQMNNGYFPGDAEIVSGRSEEIVWKRVDGVMKLVRVDRGSEGEITRIYLYAGLILLATWVGVTATRIVAHRRGDASNSDGGKPGTRPDQ